MVKRTANTTLEVLLKREGKDTAQCPYCERKFDNRRHIREAIETTLHAVNSGEKIIFRNFGTFRKETFMGASPLLDGPQEFQALRFKPTSKVFKKFRDRIP